MQYANAAMDQPAEVRAIERGMADVQAALEAVDGAARSFIARVGKVCKPEAPQPIAKESLHAMTPSCQLANELEAICTRLRNLNGALSSAHDRLEL